MSDEIAQSAGDPAAETPQEPAVPIESRFLFVDVAAQRAKQLRRGARNRLDGLDDLRDVPHKLERIAMEEVRHRLVHYQVPETPSSHAIK